MFRTLIKKTWIKCVILIALVIFVYMYIVGFIPPAYRTMTTMHVLMHRVAKHLETQDIIPSELSKLPIIKGKTDGIRDAWFRKISCMQKDDGSILLISYGRDGKPGGTGKRADITVSFRVSNGLVDYSVFKVGNKTIEEIFWKEMREELKDGGEKNGADPFFE